MAFSMLYVTCSNEKEAASLSASMLEKKLVACTNILPMKSHFWWKGELSHEDEMVVIMKTRQTLVEKVEKEILKLHSYDTPCVIHWSVTANESYEKWIEDETRDALLK